MELNVGIGNTNPTNKLDVDVNGSLRAFCNRSYKFNINTFCNRNILASTLDVTGATTINSTLSVSGKYYGDGSKLTDLNTNLIKNDNSSIDVLTKTSGDPISFDGVTTNTV